MNQKYVLITGASRGIGRACALAFARNHYHVFLNCRHSLDALHQVAKEILDEHGSCTLLPGNAGNPDDVRKMFAIIESICPGLDVLVNNAGITRDGLMPMLKDADWDAVLDANLKGAFHCMRAAYRPMMKQKYGKIINMASVVGVTGNAGQVNYAASKAGVIGMTKSMAKELANRGVTVNAIAPGFIRTAMTDVLSDDVKAEITRVIPMGIMGETEDVANLAAFLASDASRYITGQVIKVDGGMVM